MRREELPEDHKDEDYGVRQPIFDQQLEKIEVWLDFDQPLEEITR
jgi:hypothetical protein